MDLNSRRILDPALAEHLALIDDTDEIADLIAELLGLLILRPDDYDPKKVVSYVYLWINFTRLRAGAVPFLYIGSRRFIGDPSTDNYQGTNKDLNRDQAAGDDFQRYILATFEVDKGRDAYELEEAILKGIGCRVSVEFYNWKDGGRGLDSETASAIQKADWADPVKRAKRLAHLERINSDPEIRAKNTAATREAMNRPEVRAKCSDCAKKSWQDPKIAAARNQPFSTNPFYIAHISYYDEFITRLETGDFEHCDGCGKVITVEPIRASQKITCFFCENPLQEA